MIQTYLAEEIRKVKITVEEQLKHATDEMDRKIDMAEGTKGKSPRKDSAKGKKK